MNSGPTLIQQAMPFRYADLPPDIHEKILALLLRHPNPITPSSSSNNFHHTSNILPTNHQTHKEASHILYHKNTFYFPTLASLKTWLHLRSNPTPISHAIISLDLTPLGKTKKPLATREEWFDVLGLLEELLSGLRTLVSLFGRDEKGTFSDRATLMNTADSVLRAGVRSFEAVKISGQGAVDEEGFRETLSGVLTDPNRDSRRWCHPDVRR